MDSAVFVHILTVFLWNYSSIMNDHICCFRKFLNRQTAAANFLIHSLLICFVFAFFVFLGTTWTISSQSGQSRSHGSVRKEGEKKAKRQGKLKMITWHMH